MDTEKLYSDRFMALWLSGAARIWRWRGGHKGSGERRSPSGVQGQIPWWVVRGHSLLPSRKLIAVIKDIWLPNNAQFCVFTSTAQLGIFLWTQFRWGERNFLVNPISVGGKGAVPPRPWVRHCTVCTMTTHFYSFVRAVQLHIRRADEAISWLLTERFGVEHSNSGKKKFRFDSAIW